MNIVAWIIFGLVAGWIAHVSDQQPAEGGMGGALATGVLGAVTGGFLANLLFGGALLPFDIPSFIIAIVGALFLLLVHRTLFIKQPSE